MHNRVPKTQETQYTLMETSRFWVYMLRKISPRLQTLQCHSRDFSSWGFSEDITCRRSCWCYFCFLFLPMLYCLVLSYYISTWYASSSAGRQESPSEDHKLYTENHRLHTLSSSCYLSRAADIMKDPSHLGHYLFNLLPSGRWFKSITKNQI